MFETVQAGCLMNAPGYSRKKYLLEVSERVSAGGTCAQTAFLLGAVCSASVGISSPRSGACDPCSHYMNLEGGSEPPGGQQLLLAACGHRDRLCEGQSRMQK